MPGDHVIAVTVYLKHSFKWPSKTPHVQNRTLDASSSYTHTYTHAHSCTHTYGGTAAPLPGVHVSVDDAITYLTWGSVTMTFLLLRAARLSHSLLSFAPADLSEMFTSRSLVNFSSLRRHKYFFLKEEVFPITPDHITLLFSLSFSLLLDIFLFICCLSFSPSRL